VTGSSHLGGRRRLIKFSFSVSAVCLFGGLVPGCGWNNPEIDDAAERMIGTLNYPERARQIAEQFLRQYPDQQFDSYQSLTRSLLQSLGLDPEELGAHTIHALPDLLGEHVRSDFVEENVVTVRTWMLSRTEVLLCVLLTLYL